VRVAQAIALSLAEEAARQEAAGGAGGAQAGGGGGGAVESTSAGSDGSGSLKRALSPATKGADEDANSRRQRTAEAAEQARARAARSALPRRRNKPSRVRVRCVARMCAAPRRRSRDADAHRTRRADTTHPPHLRWWTRMKTQTWPRCVNSARVRDE
jgi:hypothetical protein